jgi:hypothetical protein
MSPLRRPTLSGLQVSLLLAALGLGLLVAAAWVVHVALGLAAAGVATLIMEWRVSE